MHPHFSLGQNCDSTDLHDERVTFLHTQSNPNLVTHVTLVTLPTFMMNVWHSSTSSEKTSSDVVSSFSVATVTLLCTGMAVLGVS